MLVTSLAIGDILTVGVSSDKLSKLICGCARTIAAAVELLLLTHAHASIARSFVGLLNAAARETSGNDPQGHPDPQDPAAALRLLRKPKEHEHAQSHSLTAYERG
jgi:hypothetical protein